ncbi:MAG: tungsten ABC transporter ATP-binding protein [Desulfobacterales bacterium]|nr:MAG: tungsten ABC transporter ATP-binding protein [Desulfobacterales bacterium]
MPDSLYEISKVSHFYSTQKVLEIQSLKIPRGEILGLSGPNGSGKSTFLKLLSFAMSPTHGEIRFDGRAEHPMSPRIRSRVSLLTQRPYLLKRTVLENVLYGLKIRKDTANQTQRAAAALDAVGLDFDTFKDRSWHALSGGEAQRVAMAARLILKPKALLLDEPVASVDTHSAQLIRKASLAARDAWGCTLIIVSHDLIWLNQCSDTRISVSKGRLFATKAESIIPPPYTQKDGNTVKQLPNGQYIRLPDPTGDVAVIPQNSIHIKKKETSGLSNSVNARIVEMILDQKTGNTLTTFCLEDFNLSLSVPPEQISNLNLIPGNQVPLTFISKDITWR